MARTWTLWLLLALGTPSLAQGLVISEVDPAAGWLELHNPTGAPIDSSGLWLCHRPAYAQAGGLELLAGARVVPPGSHVVLRWEAIATVRGELGLYADRSFGSPTAILDYLAWGAAGQGRERVAVAAGIWDAGLALRAPAAGRTLTRVADGVAPGEAWDEAAPTPGGPAADAR